ncbi:hypothetical protein [Streptomyces sp. NPDC005301]|uniref:hypothetical protein n=1 Tax=Streptomyces sp. NPDC005301 TaxID=3156874 RepID=UPI0033B1C930
MCVDTGQAADLVTAALAALEGGEPEDAAALYRCEKQAAQASKADALYVIVDSAALDQGAPMCLALYLQSEEAALATRLGANPRWAPSRSGPISTRHVLAQRLNPRMSELAPWEGRLVSNQCTGRWATQDGEILAGLARRLLGCMKDEKGAD